MPKKVRWLVVFTFVLSLMIIEDSASIPHSIDMKLGMPRSRSSPALELTYLIEQFLEFLVADLVGKGRYKGFGFFCCLAAQGTCGMTS